jgi:SAM-dependent methyltransferase
VRTYRTGDDYRRYTAESADRRASLKSFVNGHRRFIGRSVLDLGCGGGVLGTLLAPTGREYLGVDANPDMLREARKTGLRFLQADITRDRIPGRFDTIALLGNAISHFPIDEMDRLLAARRANVRPGTTFIVDYRDLVAMFWQDTWTRVKVMTHVRGTITHRTRLVDLNRGTLDLRARPSSRKWVLDWSHAIWSPFILEALMRSHGWLLVRRTSSRAARGAKLPEYHADVYRLEGSRSRRRAS